MTATELLTRRNAALPEIVEVLRAQQDAKLDVVAAARNLRVVDGKLRVAGVDHRISPDGVTTCDAVLTPTSSADADLAAKLDIPLPYLRRLRTHKTDLYDTNVNAWLADKPDRRFLVRGLRDSGSPDPGVLRAMLSDSYRIVDFTDRPGLRSCCSSCADLAASRGRLPTVSGTSDTGRDDRSRCGSDGVGGRSAGPADLLRGRAAVVDDRRGGRGRGSCG